MREFKGLWGPLSDEEVEAYFEREGNSQRFIGEATTVNINPDTGVIITSWPTGKSRLKKYKKGK